VAFAAAVGILYPKRAVKPGIHTTAYVSPRARVDRSCEVSPFVSVGDNSRVGVRCRIGAGTSIGERVTIGDECVIHSNVTIYGDVEIGRRVVLHSGCVIGADGFGFVLHGGRYEKFPQVGKVVIGDDVEIGANSCVDRAALGTTLIDEGSKLDNMVHVGHNCQIGKHVVIAGQTGISGGVIVEDYAVIGGQVGIGDKARIESKAVIGSGAGILSSKIVRKGEVVWGTPARPLREHLKQLANIGRIEGLREAVQAVTARMNVLESAGGQLSPGTGSLKGGAGPAGRARYSVSTIAKRGPVAIRHHDLESTALLEQLEQLAAEVEALRGKATSPERRRSSSSLGTRSRLSPARLQKADEEKQINDLREQVEKLSARIGELDSKDKSGNKQVMRSISSLHTRTRLQPPGD
jgi:UDP-3-O-[3-hydroxymyristoyl] glucosamine N-acyltransferase